MNSLTANNRLSQQLVVSVAEHLLLRHECRLPNHLAVSNHRELYLTVGGELCGNLTAGFVTEEGFMSMLFVGNQKHSALSIFAKTTRMSALVLCGNSGVILLSVKDHQHIDSAIPGRYTVQAPYKAGAGIGVLELIKAIYDAPASFLSSAFAHIKVMVGWAGASKDAPVSLITGYANPVQFTTSEIGVSGGGSISPIKEAAIMATVPALTRLNDEDLHKLSYVTTALRALRKVTLSDPQAHQVLVETLINLQAERIRLADKANLKWSTKTGHRVRVFSSIDFPIRLVVTHHYIRAVLVRCNIQRYSPLLRELHR